MKKNLLLLYWAIGVSSVFAQKKITVESVFQSRDFYEKSVSGINWMKDGGYYSSQEGADIIKSDVATGNKVETILAGDGLGLAAGFQEYEFSADEKKLLLLSDYEAIYRRSFKANYHVYDLAAKSLKKLSEGGKQSFATFSPDGSKVAFARENNLFYVDLATMKEFKLTDDGKFNYIINGSADWVYEEEFGFAKAFEWSPDGKRIAYYRFDESGVKEYNMQMWKKDDIYPVDYRFKYPKAGEANSTVKIFVHTLEGGKKAEVDLGSETDIYIPRINWTTDSNLLSVRRLNRLQNKLDIIHADAATGKNTTVLTEESKKAFVDMEYNDALTYLADGKHFIHASERDGFKHLYLYKNNGELVKQITSGAWEVDEFLGYHEKSKKLYFTSTETSPLDRDFYAIGIDGAGKTKLSSKKGTNSVNMSRDLSYYILFHSNFETPTSVALFKTEGNKQIKMLEENKAFAEKIAEYNLSKKELMSVKAADGTELMGYVIKPADFDPNKKYPVLMFVYGGPGSQTVTNAYAGQNFYWHQMLAQKGYMVACFDNRGTNGRGYDFKTSTYANLGKYEVQDQIDVAKYLGGLAYVDKSRIGIWGWSYGGYMSSLCMTVGADYFKAGIAVAPVSTWRFYDSVYTERFLMKPQDNAKGYDENSPINHASKLKGNFLLVHGTGDDNVHFQNAVMLQDALISANKQFQSFYYPNRNHGIYGGITRVHLYNMMTEFILKNL